MSAFTVTVKAGLKKERKITEQREKALQKPPSRIARQLALAHLVERLIEDGRLRNYAHAAGKLGVTRARLSQIVNLINLPPRTQNAILLGHIRVPERDLRPLLTDALWETIENCPRLSSPRPPPESERRKTF